MIRFKPNKQTTPKILINIGSLMDIPTGNFVIGARGESIMNGGLGNVTGIVGAGNNYKSTITHYMMLQAANRIAASTNTGLTTYDTEVNISLDRLENLSSKMEYLPEHPITGDDPIWSTTDKSLQAADEWVNDLNDYISEKTKSKSAIVEYTAFKDPYTKQVLKAPVPTFVEIDSLSEFEPESTIKLLAKDLDDKATNTMFMKQGMYKTKFLATLPRLSNSSNTFFLTTAHIGKKINMASGPAMYNQPTKELQYLKQDDSIKGVSSKFFFLLNNAWFAHTASVLLNQSTKLPEYPANSKDNMRTELNMVKLTQLRGKTGASGITLEILVSQIEGVLPTLTEFHFIKNNNRFGLEGSLTNYNIVLLPDVKLSRTTVRTKINNNPKLVRAINIISELLQISMFHPRYREEELICTPEELYKDIKELGYDWDDILTNTRSWWTIDNYDPKLPKFLSTLDLLKIRKKEYTPYWFKGSKNGK